MSTTEHVMIEGDIEVECECDWEFERNPFDKDAAHYGGEEDGWFLSAWKVTNGIDLTPEQSIEVDDQLNRQGPTDE